MLDVFSNGGAMFSPEPSLVAPDQLFFLSFMKGRPGLKWVLSLLELNVSVRATASEPRAVGKQGLFYFL